MIFTKKSILDYVINYFALLREGSLDLRCGSAMIGNLPGF